MANLTLRLVKESPLTNQEVDNNFTNLNTEKIERDGSVAMTGDLNAPGVEATTTSGISLKNSAGTELLVIGTDTTDILIKNSGKLGIGVANPTNPLEVSGVMSATASVKAPIFYDSANEGFYVDPAGTSNLSGLTVADTITGSVSGNAGTATKLASSRNINGTAFDGTSAITTSKWGTARTINGESVDGSTNYVIEPYVEDDESSDANRYLVFVDNSTAGYKRLNEDSGLSYNPSTGILTATTFSGDLSGNASTATSATSATSADEADKWSTARTLTLGGDLTGSVEFDGSANFTLTATVANDSHTHSVSTLSGVLPLTGGTLTGRLNGITSGSTTTGAFYGPTTGGTFSDMYTREAPYHTYVDHFGSSYAPALTIHYQYTGAYLGKYSIGHLTTSAANPGIFCIHHINSNGGSLQLWQFDGSNGNFISAGDVIAYSDERLKTDWKELNSKFIEELACVKSGTYTRIDNNERKVGVSAQDIQKIVPEAVTEDTEGYLSLAYGNAALVAAVELSKEVLSLRKEIEELKQMIGKK